MGGRLQGIQHDLLAGKPEAVGLVARWIAQALVSPRLWRLRAEWQDLHQEVLTQVVASLKRGNFDPSQDFKTYVQTIARYSAWRALAVQRASARFPPPDGPRPAPAADETLQSRQLVRWVLDQSTQECRQVILAYFFRQDSYADISRALGIPLGTVKSRLSRCLRKAARILRRAQGGRARGRPRSTPATVVAPRAVSMEDAR